MGIQSKGCCCYAKCHTCLQKLTPQAYQRPIIHPLWVWSLLWLLGLGCLVLSLTEGKAWGDGKTRFFMLNKCCGQKRQTVHTKGRASLLTVATQRVWSHFPKQETREFVVDFDAKRPHPIIASTREDLVAAPKNGICFLVNTYTGHPHAHHSFHRTTKFTANCV